MELVGGEIVVVVANVLHFASLGADEFQEASSVFGVAPPVFGPNDGLVPNAVSASCLKAFDVEHSIDTIDEIAEIEAHDLSLVVGIGSQGRSCHKFEEFVVNLDGLHALEFGCFGMDALDAIGPRREELGRWSKRIRCSRVHGQSDAVPHGSRQH